MLSSFSLVGVVGNGGGGDEGGWGIGGRCTERSFWLLLLIFLSFLYYGFASVNYCPSGISGDWWSLIFVCLGTTGFQFVNFYCFGGWGSWYGVLTSCQSFKFFL